LKNEQRGRFGQRFVFSQDLALQLTNDLITGIFFRHQTGGNVREDSTPGRDLVGIQTFSSQIQAQLVLG
jgi:hypothetical protein